MKKVLLFALLVAAAAVPSATSAQTQGPPYLAPDPTKSYNCTYTNTHLHEVDGANGGFSKFNIPNTTDFLQGTEGFLAAYNIGRRVDQRKVTFAKPFNVYLPGPPDGDRRPGGDPVLLRTRWEFTINPSGPQCKDTNVHHTGEITFLDCTDGSSRSCVPNN